MVHAVADVATQIVGSQAARAAGASRVRSAVAATSAVQRARWTAGSRLGIFVDPPSMRRTDDAVPVRTSRRPTDPVEWRTRLSSQAQPRMSRQNARPIIVD